MVSKAIRAIEQVFSEQGLLAQHLEGYAPREVQLKMAIAIATALEKKQVLIAEAGTGTGKTFAYVVPSLMSGKKVLISTGTKNLQDQLFYRDLPLLRKTLGLPIKVALLKGRSNYLCLHRLEMYLHSELLSKESQQELYRIKVLSDQNQEGDLEQLLANKSETTVIPYITSNVDNCLGQECDFFQKCHLYKARRQAQAANLVIINHHLFFADHQLKEAGVSDLLPETDAVIFDEAHQLPDIATHFLGVSLSSRQFHYLSKDIVAEQQREAPEHIEIKDYAILLTAAVQRFYEAFGPVQKGPWESIRHKPAIQAVVAEIHDTLNRLETLLQVVVERGKGLEQCWRRTAEMQQLFAQLINSEKSGADVHWFEVQEGVFSIHQTPLQVSEYFQNLMEQGIRAWIFTSATLSVAGSFSHFEENLGLKTPKKVHLDSPFEYETQALLYLPQITVEPNDADYLSLLLERAIPLLELTKGRAFLLFTSHKSLREAAAYLRRKLRFPLFIQGERSKRQLLASFCEADNAILLGTSSFWEGVDVKGSRLSCVIIDKIPFKVPDDPIYKARIDHYKKMNRNPFLEYQLPQAVISLRQGVGRLIRDNSDRGILMLCDPRLTTKDYGKIIMSSLPSMPITRRLEDVAMFLEEYA